MRERERERERDFPKNPIFSDFFFPDHTIQKVWKTKLIRGRGREQDEFRRDVRSRSDGLDGERVREMERNQRDEAGHGRRGRGQRRVWVGWTEREERIDLMHLGST